MNNQSHLSYQHMGIIITLLQRYENQRLPRLLLIERYLNQGKCLTDYHLNFLHTTIAETLENSHLLLDCPEPEYLNLFERIADLYKEITDHALANENEHLQSNVTLV